MNKSSIQDDGEQIPPDFGKKDVTILVLRKGKRSYDKYLEKNFRENYFGKYIFINQEELSGKKYANKDVYAYIFDEEFYQKNIMDGKWETKTIKPTPSSTPVTTLSRTPDYGLHTYMKYHLQDRNSGTIYRTKKGTASFSKWMRAYIQALEAARKNTNRNV